MLPLSRDGHFGEATRLRVSRCAEVVVLAALEDVSWKAVGQALRGELLASDLDEARQFELLDRLVKGKVILFGNESRELEASSCLLFSNLDTTALKGRIGQERERCDDQRLAFLAAQKHLESAGIPLLLFKSSGHYPYASSNVDALVPEGEMERAARLLEEIGHHEMVHYWEPNKRLLRKFRGASCEVMIHLHTRISWIVLAFSDMGALWRGARRSQDPVVLHPRPEHLTAILLAHSVYESNKVHIGDVWKIRQASRSAGFDWDEILRIARARSWLPGLAFSFHWYAAAEECLFGDSILASSPARRSLPPIPSRQTERIAASIAGAFPARLSNRVTKRFYFRKLLIDNPRSPLQKLHDLIGVFEQVGFGRLGLRSRPGSLICFCGIDGSGKSTHAESLRAALDECEIPNRRVWMRGGYSPFVTWVKARLRTTAAGVPDVSDAAGKLRVYRQPGTRLLWGWIVALEQIVQALLAIRVQRWLGRTLVAERYVPDTLADLSERFDDDSFPRSLPGRMMRRLCPRPDVIVFLDVSGQAAFARKPDDWSEEILEERRRRYRSVLAMMPRVRTLDAHRPFEQVSRETIDLGLRSVFEKIRRSNPLSRRMRDAWE